MERRRVLLEDGRGADRHLRVTWHPDAGQFNVSTWHGDVCAGAVRIGPDDAARLIALLADCMADAAASEAARAAAASSARAHRRFAWAEPIRAAWRARRSVG